MLHALTGKPNQQIFCKISYKSLLKTSKVIFYPGTKYHEKVEFFEERGCLPNM
nr:MAG TPA_asm: hypothetical protein [Caudoviricetes sp.]